MNMNRQQRRASNKQQKSADKAAHYGSLGVELAGQRNIEEAISAFRKAISFDPAYTNAHYCLGTLLSGQGQADDAIASFRMALDLQPDHFDSLFNMANALQMLGDFVQAEVTYRNAIAVNPHHAGAYDNLGNTLKAQGKLVEALSAYEQATTVDPNFANAYYNLGVLQMEQARPENAISSFRHALTLAPDHPALLCNLGLAYRDTNQLDDAVDCYGKALEINPDFAEAHNNLGNALHAMQRMDDAIASFKLAITTAPENAAAYANLGSIFQEIGQLEEAEIFCRQALALEPENADAHFTLAMVLLRTGRLKEGWQEYEWRWQSGIFRVSPRAFPQLQWDGSSLAGKRILLWAEQGIGDEVRYASMVPEILKSGADVTIECNERLVDIFTRSFSGTTVRPAPYKEAESGQDPFDYQCSLASLGQFFRNDFDSFRSNSGPYLYADEQLVMDWNNRLKEISDFPKIGLTWSGSISGRDRDHKNAHISELSPILSMPEITFVNLQSHDSEKDIAEAKALYGVDIHAWDDLDLRNDLENVAALTSHLDLVVSIQTFAAEFAGALGVPTLCFHSDRTSLDLLGTGNAIWYPKTKYLSKNQRDDSWQGVFVDLSDSIRERLETTRT